MGVYTSSTLIVAIDPSDIKFELEEVEIEETRYHEKTGKPYTITHKEHNILMGDQKFHNVDSILDLFVEYDYEEDDEFIPMFDVENAPHLITIRDYNYGDQNLIGYEIFSLDLGSDCVGYEKVNVDIEASKLKLQNWIKENLNQDIIADCYLMTTMSA